MAIRRLRPIQDTFIVENSSNASFGSDEILELGCSVRPDSKGCSRILIEFMVNEVEKLLGRHNLIRATLNLKYAYAENLPPVWGFDVTEIGSEWAEGQGHVNDFPGSRDGASWFKPKGFEKDEYWVGGIDPAYEDDYIWKHEYQTGYQADRDVCIDVTEWVYSWLKGPGKGLGFLIKLANEEMLEELRTRICFYSGKTHTIYKPYLELIFDDTKVEGDTENPIDDPAELNELYVDAEDLEPSHYIGEKFRVNVLARPKFPKRVFSTKSLYSNPKRYVPNLRWGIRDEHTGEILVGFHKSGTKCSFDSNGNYFILDTDLLEPERYYRLLFEVEKPGKFRKVYDSKNIFRVTKHGEI